MILPIYIYGQPVLRKVAEDITPDYPDLKVLINNMYETLDSSNGIGLAAPQIGLPIRLVVIDLDVLSEDFPEYKGFRHAFINAHILERDEENTDSSEEGCLSIPGINEKVVRPTRIHVKYMDEDFNEKWFPPNIHKEAIMFWSDWHYGMITDNIYSGSSQRQHLCLQ